MGCGLAPAPKVPGNDHRGEPKLTLFSSLLMEPQRGRQLRD